MKDKERKRTIVPPKKKIDIVVRGEISFYLSVGWREETSVNCDLIKFGLDFH